MPALNAGGSSACGQFPFAGVLSANGVRAIEGLPRLDDPAADQYLTPLNMGRW